jgi:hypothetical protein
MKEIEDEQQLKERIPFGPEKTISRPDLLASMAKAGWTEHRLRCTLTRLLTCEAVQKQKGSGNNPDHFWRQLSNG